MTNRVLAVTGFLLVGLLSVDVYFMAHIARKPADGGVACTMEAKLCPDGSSVGRSGPRCTFARCPDVATVTTARVGQKIVISGISITPLGNIQDSRCPVDVTCIQAGTVRVLAKFERDGGTQEATLTPTQPITFAGTLVELVGVTPAPHSKKILAEKDYLFDFRVTPSE